MGLITRVAKDSDKADMYEGRKIHLRVYIIDIKRSKVVNYAT